MDKHGKLDTDKIVTETIFDEAKKGVWVLEGKRGHFEFEEFDERAFKERKIEDDGADPFAEERQQAKRTAVIDGFRNVSKAREAKAIDMPTVGLEEMLKMAKETIGGQEEGATTKTCDDEESDSQKLSEDEAPTMSSGKRSKLMAIFGASVQSAGSSSLADAGTGKAPPKSKKCGGSGVKSATASGQVSSLATAPRTSAMASLPDAAGSGKKRRTDLCSREDVVLDGRGARLKSTLDSCAAESESALEDVDMYSDSVIMLNTAKADRPGVGKHISECSRIVAKVESQAKLVYDRVEKSANATLLSTEMQRLANVREKAKAMSMYLKLLRDSNPDPEAFSHTMASLIEFGAEFSQEHHALALHMSCMHALMFSDFDTLMSFFNNGSREAR